MIHGTLLCCLHPCIGGPMLKLPVQGAKNPPQTAPADPQHWAILGSPQDLQGSVPLWQLLWDTALQGEHDRDCLMTASCILQRQWLEAAMQQLTSMQPSQHETASEQHSEQHLSQLRLAVDQHSSWPSDTAVQHLVRQHLNPLVAAAALCAVDLLAAAESLAGRLQQLSGSYRLAQVLVAMQPELQALPALQLQQAWKGFRDRSAQQPDDRIAHAPALMWLCSLLAAAPGKCLQSALLVLYSLHICLDRAALDT